MSDSLVAATWVACERGWDGVGRSLYERAEARRDVLEGVLADSVFATSLEEVTAGTTPAAYGDPTVFFGSPD